MNHAAEVLRAGCEILSEVLVPERFEWVQQDTGNSSGGVFAWGQYVRGDRRLELHFRHSLGLVTYRLGDESASHDWLVRCITGAQGSYPGFSDEPLDGFRHLRDDIQTHCSVFLRGDDDQLRTALRLANRMERDSPKGLTAI